MSETPSYYAIIPASVRYADITANAKLLYGEITALCESKGFCWASNGYFAKLYKVDVNAVSLWVQELAELGVIECEVDRAAGNKRTIRLTVAIPKMRETSPEKSGDPYPEKSGAIENTTRLNIKSNVPPSGSPQPTKATKRATSRQRLAAHLGQCDQCPAEWANHASRSGFSQHEIDSEWIKFVDHHTARGNVMADWFAAWRTWCRNALEFAARNRQRGARASGGTGGNLVAALSASVADRERRQRAEGSVGGPEGNLQDRHHGGGDYPDPERPVIPF